MNVMPAVGGPSNQSVSDKTIFILGAGADIPLGMPAMRTLMKELADWIAKGAPGEGVNKAIRKHVPKIQFALGAEAEKQGEMLGETAFRNSGQIKKLKAEIEKQNAEPSDEVKAVLAVLNAAFTVLLEPFEALCGQLLRQEMESYLPDGGDERRYYFDPYIDSLPKKVQNELRKHQRNLQRNLVHNAHSNRIGNLLFCLSFAVDGEFQGIRAGGVWDDVAEAFSEPSLQAIRPQLVEMNEFRNRRVVHVEEPITDSQTAEANLRKWIEGLILISRNLT